MNSPTAYAWTGTEVLALETVYGIDRTPLFNRPIVDLTEEAPPMRYGTFGATGWSPIPLDRFPPEFRVQLLLLGIT